MVDQEGLFRQSPLAQKVLVSKLRFFEKRTSEIMIYFVFKILKLKGKEDFDGLTLNIFRCGGTVLLF